MGRRALDQTEALRQCRELNAEQHSEIERLRADFAQVVKILDPPLPTNVRSVLKMAKANASGKATEPEQ